MISFETACREVGIDPTHIPDLTAPPRSDEPLADPFFHLVEPMTDAEWACLRQAIPPGRRGDQRDRQFVEALRTLIRYGEGALNWTLLRTPYGTCTAVRMRWIRWCELGRFTELLQDAESTAIEGALRADLQRLALEERSYNERVKHHRSLRVTNKQKSQHAREPHI